MVISKVNNGLLCLLILRWLFFESLSSCNKRSLPFSKVWIAKFKSLAKGSYLESFMKNIMYLLDIEKADDVDVYYYSDGSDYDDEELYDIIYFCPCKSNTLNFLTLTVLEFFNREFLDITLFLYVIQQLFQAF